MNILPLVVDRIFDRTPELYVGWFAHGLQAIPQLSSFGQVRQQRT
jgi:hypothetical protein